MPSASSEATPGSRTTVPRPVTSPPTAQQPRRTREESCLEAGGGGGGDGERGPQEGLQALSGANTRLSRLLLCTVSGKDTSGVLSGF